MNKTNNLGNSSDWRVILLDWFALRTNPKFSRFHLSLRYMYIHLHVDVYIEHNSAFLYIFISEIEIRRQDITPWLLGHVFWHVLNLKTPISVKISPELKKPLHGWQGEGRSCSDWVLTEGEIWQGEDIWGLFTSRWNAGELCLYFMQFLFTAMKVFLSR